MTQKSKAELLRRLHSGPEVLVLPNAWDALSARIVEAEGYPAIATSSAGCAAVLGYPDGQLIPRSEMIFLVAKIAAAVKAPVTADLEAGYDDVEQTALDMIAAGAVGLNLEDLVGEALLSVDEQTARIRAVRRIGEENGVPVVINARTDIYLARLGDPETRFERTVERLRAYRAAGADCLFVPGVKDAETIGRLVRAAHAPLNILAVPGSPSIPEMKALGVARVSCGSGTSRVAMGALRRFVQQLQERGTFEALGTEAMAYTEIQGLLARGK